MNKNTRILLITIGALSILSGIYGFVTETNLSMNFLAIFIGVSIIGSVFYQISKKLDKNQ